jgi:hypothetical protein
MATRRKVSTSCCPGSDRWACAARKAHNPIRWIVISMHGIPDWASEVCTTEVPFRTTGARAQAAALPQGIGITTLPCFVELPTPTVEGAEHRSAHARNALLPYTWGNTQDEARTALHEVRIPQVSCLRLAPGGAVPIGRLTPERSPASCDPVGS